MERMKVPKVQSARRSSVRQPADASQPPNRVGRFIELQRLGGSNRAVARLLTATLQRDTDDPVERVQKAIASSNLDVLIAVQHSLRAELAKDPLKPPATCARRFGDRTPLDDGSCCGNP